MNLLEPVAASELADLCNAAGAVPHMGEVMRRIAFQLDFWKEQHARLEAKLRGNLCDQIARDRGWHPLTVGEEMTVHFDAPIEGEPRRQYLITRKT